jgi:hypothetical protein
MSDQKMMLAILALLVTVGTVFFMSPNSISSPFSLSRDDFEDDDLQCINRSEIMNNARNWTGKGPGYRNDSGGYISMCWGLDKPGLSISSLHTVTANITKDGLQPGDAMLCDRRHAALFDTWADQNHTHYYAFEWVNSTVHRRSTPYPYWGNDTCFHPVRFTNVC